MFVEVMSDLTSEQAQGDEDRFAAMLKIMDDEHASEIARRIFELYCELDRHLMLERGG